MTCHDVEARITAYLGGELDPTSASALRGHLRACAACHALAEDHARIAGALAELPPAEPPPSLWDGVMARLAETEAVDARRSRASLWLRGAWARLRPHLVPAGVVGAAAATAAALWIARHRGPVVDEPGRAAVHAGAGRAAPADPPGDDPADPRDLVDIEDALAAERARIDRRYADAVAELLADVAEERVAWPAAQQRTFDAELARLRAALDDAPAATPGIGGPGADHFERAEAVLEATERRERAWQRIVAFLQRAALGERVALREVR